MSTSTKTGDDTKFKGLAKILQLLYGCMDGVAIKCALDLNIADIINNHDGPITLSQITSEINSPSLNIDGLLRLMRFMVHRQMFDLVHQPDCIEPLYSLNMCSQRLVHNSKTTIAPLAIMVTDSQTFPDFFNLDKSILKGSTSMKNTCGLDLWDFLSANPQVNKTFNEGMACRTRISMDAIMSTYKFDKLNGTLADVGGGIGAAINEIVNAYPHLKGINFDLPHVISTAPTYKGVTQIGGDMFKAIPSSDSIFLKSILHNWSDNECIQILQNCRDCIPKKTGKIIIVDIILHPGGDDMFEDTRIVHDLVMLSSFDNGKERTEVEWKKILSEAGFSRYNVINTPAIESIIEAYVD